MPRVTIHKAGEVHVGEVPGHTNLVVKAGIRQFPFPHLRYGCGMGKCGRCACRVRAGAEQLPPPNWKEEQRLGELLAEGYRLPCQFWIDHDLELEQDGRVVPLNAPGRP